MKRRTAILAVAAAVSGGCVEQRPIRHAEGEESDGSPTPSERNVDPGTIEIVVNGDELDLSADRFRTEQTESNSAKFHLDGQSGTWQVTGDDPVTIAEGIDQLPDFGYERDGWRTVTIGDTPYDERDDATETAFFVDGEIVDPEGYELRDGDSIQIAITTDGAVTHEDPSGQVDASGTLEIVVDGEQFDLTQDRFQAEHADDAPLEFHLHDGSDRWFMEGAQRVTFGEGLNLLPQMSYARGDGYHTLGIDTDEHTERDLGTELGFFADGDLVNPLSFDLRDGDHLRVEVTTGR